MDPKIHRTDHEGVKESCIVFKKDVPFHFYKKISRPPLNAATLLAVLLIKLFYKIGD
ncbi:hypothetical protein ACQKP0_20195 [Heyndrickxia sp. NPDC080065]|uniref:hypothetical protein n=1 Tax=Heyndrickxia sp. NPDC080065 TaxID=3390568 RepID=UPI003D00FD9B